MAIARRGDVQGVEKISIQLIAERDGGYESGAGYMVPAGTFLGQISLAPRVTGRRFCFKNGVLEILLKTGKISLKPRIEIE
jgi:hypothetical protein